MQQCVNCTRPVRKAYWAKSRICERCQKTIRRYGSPTEKPLRKTEVQKFVNRVQKLIKPANVEMIEAALQDTMTMLVERASNPETYRHKPWVNRWKAAACAEVLRVLEDTNAMTSGLVIAAVFLMRAEEHDSWRPTDKAFLFQLVRMWRMYCSRLSVGSWFNPKTGRVQTWYKIMPPKVTLEIASLLLDVYVPWTARVLAAYRRTHVRNAAPRKLFDAAFTPRAE